MKLFASQVVLTFSSCDVLCVLFLTEELDLAISSCSPDVAVEPPEPSGVAHDVDSIPLLRAVFIPSAAEARQPTCILRIVKSQLSSERALGLDPGVSSATAIGRHRILQVSHAEGRVYVAMKSYTLQTGNTQLLSAKDFRQCGLEKLRKHLISWVAVDTVFTLMQHPWSFRGHAHFQPVSKLLTSCVRADAMPGKTGLCLLWSDKDHQQLAVARGLKTEDLVSVEPYDDVSFRVCLTPRGAALLEAVYVLKAAVPTQMFGNVLRSNSHTFASS